MDTGSIRTTEEEALQFHANERPGKLSIAPTKPLTTPRDLSLAYSPGVAFPCLHIHPRWHRSRCSEPRAFTACRLNRCRVINRARDKC
jgi:malic enzyme